MFENVSKNMPLLIVGAGLTGQSVARYCQKNGLYYILFDHQENQASSIVNGINDNEQQLGIGVSKISDEELESCSLVVKSPGISLEHSLVKRAIAASKLITSDIDIFLYDLANRPNDTKIIAVTGSNGKTTVCDCLEYVLRKAGHKAVAAGNIGMPVLDLLATSIKGIVILELSSFQLEMQSQLRANAATILNMSEDHLDRHGSFSAYVAAKQLIYKNCDSAIVNLDDTNSTPKYTVKSLVTFGQSSEADFQIQYTKDGFLVSTPNNHCLSESECVLKGMHNGINFAAVLALIAASGIKNESAIIDAIKQYAGLRHRCEAVDSNDHIRWINDSKATNPGAAIAAISSFYKSNTRLFLIAGGDAKGANLEPLLRTIGQYVEHAWVYGKDAAQFSSHDCSNVVSKVSDLSDAVHQAKRSAQSNDTVLLSPGCASIDQYKNYEERGEHFISLVKGASA